jgi:DNA-binding transcriptional LysR family regulator
MELRQLEAFTAVAAELHFGRAAERLHMGQPALSELIQRLERELGTPLYTRTTRRVALTGAGSELLGRAKVILDETAAAKAAVRRIAAGDAGAVRVGITPPAAPVLAPHLRDALSAQIPGIELRIQRMWLPHLTRAIADGAIDVAITCGLVPDPDGAVGEVFCGIRAWHSRLRSAQSCPIWRGRRAAPAHHVGAGRTVYSSARPLLRLVISRPG